MSEQPEQLGRRWAHYFVWVLVLLVLYPLSMGPCTWALHAFNIDPIFGKSPIDKAGVVFVILYLPIIWLIDEYPSASTPMVWYLDFWERRAP